MIRLDETIKFGFILRSWAPGDLESLVRYADNYEVAKNLTDQFPHPYTIENGREFIMNATSQSPHRILAIDIQGVACGAIGIHPQSDIHRANAELGYWLAQPHWGKGIMTRAITAMVRYGFAHWEIKRIFARPFGSNIASQRVLEKAGFTLEARLDKTILKNGEFFDELIYAVRKPD